MSPQRPGRRRVAHRPRGQFRRHISSLSSVANIVHSASGAIDTAATSSTFDAAAAAAVLEAHMAAAVAALGPSFLPPKNRAG